MFLRAGIIWFGLMVLAIANGAFRESVLLPRTGSLRGHQISTISLCALIFALGWLTVPWIDPSTVRDALQVGLMWGAMTLAFELGFGRIGARKTWSELLADYNLSAGRIWVLVLITVVLTPWIVASARGLI